MSSNVTLHFDRTISVGEWAGFCTRNGIEFSPGTVGQNVFYKGEVQITLEGQGTVKKDDDGRIRPDTARPPASFSRMSVESYFCKNLDEIGRVAKDITSAFACQAVPSPELTHDVFGIPLRYEAGSEWEDDRLVQTDVPQGWQREGDVLVAKVDAGRATIRTGDLVILEIDGIERAVFRQLSSAMTYAGRCDWEWWQGPMPSGDLSLASQPKALR